MRTSCSLKNKHKHVSTCSPRVQAHLEKMNQPLVNDHREYKISAFWKPWACLHHHLHFYTGWSFTSIWLFTHFEEQLRRVIIYSHPRNTSVIGKFQALPGISCYPSHHSFLKRRVFFKLFSTDSINMKRSPSYWPLQLVKGIGSAIPPLDFNLFGLEGSLHKKIERLFCSTR